MNSLDFQTSESKLTSPWEGLVSVAMFVGLIVYIYWLGPHIFAGEKSSLLGLAWALVAMVAWVLALRRVREEQDENQDDPPPSLLETIQMADLELVVKGLFWPLFLLAKIFFR